ncbi:MAG TPA: PorV/PorQ family protein [Candidatus Eisenbacteria bacterium]|jgi:hypothetical protein
MRILKLCIGATLVMALIAAGFAHADIDLAGTNAANFLSVGTGARILGMGGATLGLGDDVGAVAWNPAALGWTGSTQVVLSHAGLTNESLQEWMAVGGRLGRTQTRASVSALYQGDGSIEGRDASNNPTAAITASSFAVAGLLAQRIGHTITLGVTGKAVNEKLGDVSGTGYTWDAGMMVRVGMVGFGVAGQNLTGRMDYDGAQYPFARTVGAGIGVTHAASGLRFALDANFPDAYYDDVRTGVEWMWKDVLALRGGYRYELGDSPENDPLSGPSFGIGAGKNGFWLDYGYLISNDGGGQHRVGLKFLPALWNGLHSDPFGQREMPREFEKSPPPAPKGKKK